MGLKSAAKNVWKDTETQNDTNAFAKAGAVVETRRPQELRVSQLTDYMEDIDEKPPKYAEKLGNTIALPFGSAGNNKVFHHKTVAFQKLSSQLKWLKMGQVKNGEAEDAAAKIAIGKVEDELNQSLENAFAPYALMYIADSFTKPPHVDVDDVIVLHTPPVLKNAGFEPRSSGLNLGQKAKDVGD